MRLARIIKPSNVLASIISILLASASFYLVLSNKDVLPPEIPLWYSKVWGKQRLAGQDWMLIIPVLIILVFLVNETISKLVESESLAKIITWSSVVFGLVITYSLLRILFLVT